MREVIIRRAQENEFEHWKSIYQHYLNFYRAKLSEIQLQQVWKWAMNGKDGMQCLLAIKKNQYVGLTHFRTFIRPIKAQQALFIDDLIVVPEHKGTGAGFALIKAVKQYANQHNIDLVRWITADDNKQAMKLYDRVATKTNWVTYDF